MDRRVTEDRLAAIARVSLKVLEFENSMRKEHTSEYETANVTNDKLKNFECRISIVRCTETCKTGFNPDIH